MVGPPLRWTLLTTILLVSIIAVRHKSGLFILVDLYQQSSRRTIIADVLQKEIARARSEDQMSNVTLDVLLLQEQINTVRSRVILSEKALVKEHKRLADERLLLESEYKENRRELEAATELLNQVNSTVGHSETSSERVTVELVEVVRVHVDAPGKHERQHSSQQARESAASGGSEKSTNQNEREETGRINNLFVTSKVNDPAPAINATTGAPQNLDTSTLPKPRQSETSSPSPTQQHPPSLTSGITVNDDRTSNAIKNSLAPALTNSNTAPSKLRRPRSRDTTDSRHSKNRRKRRRSNHHQQQFVILPTFKSKEQHATSPSGNRGDRTTVRTTESRDTGAQSGAYPGHLFHRSTRDTHHDDNHVASIPDVIVDAAGNEYVLSKRGDSHDIRSEGDHTSTSDGSGVGVRPSLKSSKDMNITPNPTRQRQSESTCHNSYHCSHQDHGNKASLEEHDNHKRDTDLVDTRRKSKWLDSLLQKTGQLRSALPKYLKQKLGTTPVTSSTLSPLSTSNSGDEDVSSSLDIKLVSILDSSLLSDLLLFILVGTVSGLIAPIFGLPSLAGQLAGGATIGPFLLDLISRPVQVATVTQIGTILLAFSLGTSIGPRSFSFLRHLRKPTESLASSSILPPQTSPSSTVSPRRALLTSLFLGLVYSFAFILFFIMTCVTAMICMEWFAYYQQHHHIHSLPLDAPISKQHLITLRYQGESSFTIASTFSNGSSTPFHTLPPDSMASLLHGGGLVLSTLSPAIRSAFAFAIDVVGMPKRYVHIPLEVGPVYPSSPSESVFTPTQLDKSPSALPTTSYLRPTAHHTSASSMSSSIFVSGKVNSQAEDVVVAQSNLAATHEGTRKLHQIPSQYIGQSLNPDPFASSKPVPSLVQASPSPLSTPIQRETHWVLWYDDLSILRASFTLRLALYALVLCMSFTATSALAFTPPNQVLFDTSLQQTSTSSTGNSSSPWTIEVPLSLQWTLKIGFLLAQDIILFIALLILPVACSTQPPITLDLARTPSSYQAAAVAASLADLKYPFTTIMTSLLYQLPSAPLSSIASFFLTIVIYGIKYLHFSLQYLAFLNIWPWRWAMLPWQLRWCALFVFRLAIAAPLLVFAVNITTSFAQRLRAFVDKQEALHTYSSVMGHAMVDHDKEALQSKNRRHVVTCSQSTSDFTCPATLALYKHDSSFLPPDDEGPCREQLVTSTFYTTEDEHTRGMEADEDEECEQWGEEDYEYSDEEGANELMTGPGSQTRFHEDMELLHQRHSTSSSTAPIPKLRPHYEGGAPEKPLSSSSVSTDLPLKSSPSQCPNWPPSIRRTALTCHSSLISRIGQTVFRIFLSLLKSILHIPPTFAGVVGYLILSVVCTTWMGRPHTDFAALLMGAVVGYVMEQHERDDTITKDDTKLDRVGQLATSTSSLSPPPSTPLKQSSVPTSTSIPPTSTSTPSTSAINPVYLILSACSACNSGTKFNFIVFTSHFPYLLSACLFAVALKLFIFRVLLSASASVTGARIINIVISITYALSSGVSSCLQTIGQFSSRLIYPCRVFRPQCIDYLLHKCLPLFFGRPKNNQNTTDEALSLPYRSSEGIGDALQLSRPSSHHITNMHTNGTSIDTHGPIPRWHQTTVVDCERAAIAVGDATFLITSHLSSHSCLPATAQHTVLAVAIGGLLLMAMWQKIRR